MSREIINNRVIEDDQMLLAYFKAGEKSVKDFRIGTEHEKFVFRRSDFSAVAYEGKDSIGEILLQLQQKLNWQPIYDQGKLIGLVGQAGEAISIEPAGQLEFATSPNKDIFEAEAQIEQHFALAKDIADKMDIGFLSLGCHPMLDAASSPKMPKSRYDIMRNYMPKVGSRGLNMMHCTSTIQVNLDYGSEEDMRQKMQIGMKLQPIATALFASSPFFAGQLTKNYSQRAYIWQDTDGQRSGLLPFVWRDDFGYRDYLNFALNVNMYFIIREGKYIDCTSLTFGEFLQRGYAGYKATMGDFINHLSTLFPEARLKSYIEMRGADAGLCDMIYALPAFWVGLLYSETALKNLQEYCKNWSYDVILALYQQLPSSALSAQLLGKKLQFIALDLLEIAKAGLKERALGEEAFLAPLEFIAKSGKNRAQEMQEKYQTIWQNSLEPLFTEYSY